MTQAEGTDSAQPVADGGGGNQHEAVYLEHARWLLEWHDRRSEAFMTRAVGLLGLVGVLDALLLQQVSRSGAPEDGLGWVLLAATLILLLASALFALLTLTSKEVSAPSIEQLRDWWSAYLQGERQEHPKADVVENVLHGTKPNSDSPLDSASKAATCRAWHFKRAVIALSLSLLGLALFVVQLAVAA